MRFSISIFFACVVTSPIPAQEIHIIPQPVHLIKKQENFIISKTTPIIVRNEEDKKTVDFLNIYLNEFYGFQLTLKKKELVNSISISTNEVLRSDAKDAYTLESGPSGIVIRGDSYAGTFNGMQTLIQLLPTQKSPILKIPSVEIQDEPRFGHRGSLLDVGRHFFPVSFIKKYIDFLALHKMNFFHWHLTDDPGWRIEIRKYPRLTEIGAWRNKSLVGRYPGVGFINKRYGGYYTQEEIKDIIEYAANRYITILPEIEMPGHSFAALASYPKLGCTGGPYTVPDLYRSSPDVFCAGNEYTFEFLQNVLDEVMALFPSKYIHIGGDECPKEGWKKCPRCQKRMKDNNLKDENELQSYFIQRVEKYLNSKGRILIGWDEILEGGLAPNAVVMSWRGEQVGIAAAKGKHYIIMTPSSDVYLDYPQIGYEDSVTIGGYTPIEKVYNYEPIPKELSEEESKYVLGAQGNVWTEYMTNPKKVEYMLFPRIAALSEVLWSPKGKRDWDDFEKRLMTQSKRYDLWKTNYNKEFFNLTTKLLPAEDHHGVVLKLETKNRNSIIRYNLAGPGPTWLTYKEPIIINKTQKLSAALIDETKTIFQLTQPFHFNRATGKEITLVKESSDNFPGNGPFTLVDGIQNTKGLSKQTEFLGFLGTDCEAIIDLGISTSISNVKVHVYHQEGTWIYRPRYLEIFSSADGKSFTPIAKTEKISASTGNAVMEKKFTAVASRYVKIVVKNWGDILNENPYGDNKAWLLVDEIEIN